MSNADDVAGGYARLPDLAAQGQLHKQSLPVSMTHVVAALNMPTICLAAAATATSMLMSYCMVMRSQFLSRSANDYHHASSLENQHKKIVL